MLSYNQAYYPILHLAVERQMVLQQSTTEAISPTYLSFLVRLWQERPTMHWRASAQSVQTGEVFHFATLNALAIFLQAQGGSTQKDASTSIE
jgi:hypothetical protein